MWRRRCGPTFHRRRRGRGASIAGGQHAVLLSSHIVSDIEKLCGRVVFLHKGHVLLDEEKDALLTTHPEKTLEDILLGMIEGGRSV